MDFHIANRMGAWLKNSDAFIFWFSSVTLLHECFLRVLAGSIKVDLWRGMKCGRGEAAFNGLSFSGVGGGGIDLPSAFTSHTVANEGMSEDAARAVSGKIFKSEELPDIDQTAIQIFCRNFPGNSHAFIHPSNWPLKSLSSLYASLNSKVHEYPDGGKVCSLIARGLSLDWLRGGKGGRWEP